jgi:hypothetical protein
MVRDMDTMTTLPPAGDPVQAEVEDSVRSERASRSKGLPWRTPPMLGRPDGGPVSVTGDGENRWTQVTGPSRRALHGWPEISRDARNAGSTSSVPSSPKFRSSRARADYWQAIQALYGVALAGTHDEVLAKTTAGLVHPATLHTLKAVGLSVREAIDVIADAITHQAKRRNP